jgi:hypothetical protein
VLSARHYEALEAELKRLRRAELLRDVAEAEAEVRRGDLPAYEDVAAVMRDLETESGGSTGRLEEAGHG